MQKKKIIFSLNSLLMGGEEVLAFHYIDILKEYYSIELIINENYGEDNYFENKIPKNVSYEFVVDKEISNKLFYYKRNKNKNIYYKIMYNLYLSFKKRNFLKNINKILKNKEYDLIINFSLTIPGELLDRRSITWINCFLGDFYSRRGLQRIKNQFINSKKIIATCEKLAEEIKVIYPEIEPKTDFIWNSFEIDKINELSNESNDLDEMEMFLLKQNYFLACGRIDKIKDYPTLIQSFKEFLKQKPSDYYLYILGDGVDREKTEQLVKKLDIEEKVKFLGIKSNPYVWMKNANVFIHTSISESFGRVIVEAMICGTPVIATDCPVGPREILEDGKNGILVEVGDYKEISRSIEKILWDNALKDKYVKNALKRSEDFSEEKQKTKLLELIKIQL